MKGFTLNELLIATAIFGIALTSAVPQLYKFIQTQRVVSHTNHVAGIIRLAKSESFLYGKILLCDANYRCEDFKKTTRIALYTRNPDGDLTEIASISLPGSMSIQWNRFRGNALSFHSNGILHYQNGSFLICNKYAARRIVMNWVGRTRIEKAAPNSDCQAEQ